MAELEAKNKAEAKVMELTLTLTPTLTLTLTLTLALDLTRTPARTPTPTWPRAGGRLPVAEPHPERRRAAHGASGLPTPRQPARHLRRPILPRQP